jgi:DNA processing protein
MSGISLGVLVTEAGEKGGVWHTVGWALEQNREVFAVPGSILSPMSYGTNRLIQEGAKLVRDASDVLEELNLTMVPQQAELRELVPSDETEALLLRQLSYEPTHIDDVCHSSRLPISVVSSALAMMELKGMVRQVGRMNYVLSSEVRV